MFVLLALCASLSLAAASRSVEAFYIGTLRLTAVLQLQMERPALTKAVSEISTFEAASYARQPTWYAFAIPLIGAAGILLGGNLRRRRTPSRPSPAPL